MATSVQLRPAIAPLDILQERRRPVKADLKNLQDEPKWKRQGEVVAAACMLARLSRKEFAARLNVGENQLGAWVAGKERPQFDLFEADDVLAGPLAVAKALQKPGVFDVRWTITAKVRDGE